jgi:hypothetical protein
MQLGTTHSGHPSLARASAPARPCPGLSATPVSRLCGPCVSALSLNLSTDHPTRSGRGTPVESTGLPKPEMVILRSPPVFGGRRRISRNRLTQHRANSPLCFHILTNSFSDNLFPLIFFRTARGVCPPRYSKSLGALVSSTCARRSERIHPRRAVLTAPDRFSTFPDAVYPR